VPSPKATPIILSDRQQLLLKQIVRRTTNPHRFVRRAQLILAVASGASNTQISLQLQLDRGQVRLWRHRWLGAATQLAEAEAAGVSDTQLRERITSILCDRSGRGTPNFFSTEQVVQIVALACERPQASEHPVSHWTPSALANEAVKRNIVEKISPRSVGRFLKRSNSTASSQPLLAQCES
jgi:putative transposase